MDKRGNAVFLELENGKKIVVEYEDWYSDMKYAGQATSIKAFARCTYELSEYQENGSVHNPSKSNKIRSYIKGNGSGNSVALLRKMICEPNGKFNNTELEFVTELKTYFDKKKVDLGQVVKIIVLNYEVQEWTNCEDYGGTTVPSDWAGIEAYDDSKNEELAREYNTDVESIVFYKNAASSDDSWIKETSEYITIREEWLYIPKTEEYTFVVKPKDLDTDFVESFDSIYEWYRKRVERLLARERGEEIDIIEKEETLESVEQEETRNKALETLDEYNKLILEDELWRGRFVLCALNENKYIYKGDPNYLTIRICDKKTGLFRDRSFDIYQIASSNWALYWFINDFIIKDVKVWEENPNPQDDDWDKTTDWSKVPMQALKNASER